MRAKPLKRLDTAKHVTDAQYPFRLIKRAVTTSNNNQMQCGNLEYILLCVHTSEGRGAEQP